MRIVPQVGDVMSTLSPYTFLQITRMVNDGLVIQGKGYLTRFTRCPGALDKLVHKRLVKK